MSPFGGGMVELVQLGIVLTSMLIHVAIWAAVGGLGAWASDGVARTLFLCTGLLGGTIAIVGPAVSFAVQMLVVSQLSMDSIMWGHVGVSALATLVGWFPFIVLLSALFALGRASGVARATSEP